MLKQVKLNFLIFLGGVGVGGGVEFSGIKKNNCCFTDRQQNFNAGMHSDVYEWITFKLRVIIDEFELCILILV